MKAGDFFSKSSLSSYGWLLILLLTVVVYLPSLENGYIWDDDMHSGSAYSKYEKGFQGFASIWLNTRSNPQYYPLLYSSFLIDYHFWGEDPFGSHLVNILLHALVAIMLWRVLLLLKIRWALAIALLFALHPVHVESVAWIAERKNVLSGALYMISMWAFLKWYLEKNNRWFYSLSLLFFLFAMLTKTVTCTLPAVLILLMWWKKQEGEKHEETKPLLSSILWTLPFFLILLRFVYLTITMEQYHAGAIGLEWDISFWERVLIAGRAVLFYAEKLLWPVNLTFIYPRWQIDTAEIWQWAPPLVVLGLIGVLWLGRKKFGAGILVGYLVFCGSLFPALGFFNIYPMRFSFVADHFQYLSSIAMITVYVAIAMTVLKSVTPQMMHKFLSPLLLIGILSFYAHSSQDLQRQYKNEEVLWKSTLKKNKEVFLAYNNLGVMSQNKGPDFYDEALGYYQQALAVKPDYPTSLLNMAQIHFNRGKNSETGGDFKKALSLIERATQIHELDLDHIIEKAGRPLYFKEYSQAHLLRGKILWKMERTESACKVFRDLYEKIPRSYKALNHLANCFFYESGQEKKAAELLFKSIQIRADQPKALGRLGTLYYKTGQLEMAIKYLKQSLTFDKELHSTLFYLARSYHQSGQKEKAYETYSQLARRPLTPRQKEIVEKTLANWEKRP